MWKILSRSVSCFIFHLIRLLWSIWAALYFILAGRGLKSHAYTHSVQFTHHVFLNLHTLKFYCLPDNYEIIDSSLEDITVRSTNLKTSPWHQRVNPLSCDIRLTVKFVIFNTWLKTIYKPLCVWLSLQYVLKPTFTKQHISGLDKQGKLHRAYDGTTYLPGIVGLNNIKANDYANVVLQVLKPWTGPYLNVFALKYKIITLLPSTLFPFSGFLQCSTFAKLLPGGGELQRNPQATRGYHVPFGAEVWWAHA